MKRIALLIFLIFSVAVCGGAAYATAETGKEITETSAVDLQTCREIIDLAKKYEVTAKLPATVVISGKPCPKGEVAVCFLAVIEKVLEKCRKEGNDAIAQEDLEKINALHEALQDELSKYEGYLSRREEIASILAKPEEPAFEYKFGVNGSVRGEGVGNFRLTDFSYAPGHGEGRFLYRVKPYAYWHPTDYLDIHLEGQGYGFTGGSQYYGRVSLYQGFIEGKLPDKELLALKVGRQEFSYGSTFILGPNSFYDGLVFDAVRLRVRPAKPLTVDFLGGLYGAPFATGMKGNLAGVYSIYKFSDDDAIDMYGFNDTGSTEHHAGEHRDIWGLRGTAKFGPVSVEFEPVFETGRVYNPVSGGNDNICAFGGHIDLNMESSLAGHKDKFLVSYAFGSGDREAAAGVRFRKEFRNPDNDSSLVGDMTVIADLSGITVGDHHASGLHDFTFGWGVDITKELNFSATGHYFLADEVESGFSRNLGLETDFTLTYAMNDNLSVIAGYDHFFTGGFFRDATGSTKNIDYGYLMLQFDISKSKPKLKPIKGLQSR